MTTMQKRLYCWILSATFVAGMFGLFYAAAALADDSSLSPQDFLSSIFNLISSFGGLNWMLKVAAVVSIFISSFKVSFLNSLVWNKLGGFKTWAAPILGLLAGIFSLGSSGNISLAGVFAYLSAGAGAIILHELLDTIKLIPGLGAVYIGIIDTIEGFLGGPASESKVLK